jgi:hypothetical protein
MDDEERQQLRDLLRARQSRLHVLEVQAAAQGIQTPPQVVVEINGIHSEIEHLETELAVNTPAVARTQLRHLRQVALKAYFAQRWAEAEESFIQVLAIDPDDKDIQMKLSEVQQQLDLQAFYQAICELRDAGLWPAVLKALDELERKQPNYPDSENLRRWAEEQQKSVASVPKIKPLPSTDAASNTTVKQSIMPETPQATYHSPRPQSGDNTEISHIQNWFTPTLFVQTQPSSVLETIAIVGLIGGIVGWIWFRLATTYTDLLLTLPVQLIGVTFLVVVSPLTYLLTKRITAVFLAQVTTQIFFLINFPDSKIVIYSLVSSAVSSLFLFLTRDRIPLLALVFLSSFVNLLASNVFYGIIFENMASILAYSGVHVIAVVLAGLIAILTAKLLKKY